MAAGSVRLRAPPHRARLGDAGDVLREPPEHAEAVIGEAASVRVVPPFGKADRPLRHRFRGGARV
jgi:hypothetical protein